MDFGESQRAIGVVAHKSRNSSAAIMTGQRKRLGSDDKAPLYGRSLAREMHTCRSSPMRMSRGWGADAFASRRDMGWACSANPHESVLDVRRLGLGSDRANLERRKISATLFGIAQGHRERSEAKLVARITTAIVYSPWL